MERNFDIWEKELIAIKAAFEERHRLLEGPRFPVQVLRDHKNLEYLWTVRHLNQWEVCWSLLFAWLNLIITCHPVSKNLSCKDEYLDSGRGTPSTVLKVSNFVNGTTDSNLMSSSIPCSPMTHSQLRSTDHLMMPVPNLLQSLEYRMMSSSRKAVFMFWGDSLGFKPWITTSWSLWPLQDL